MTLGEKLHGKNERLNAVKFIAALMVIFSHSFDLNGEGGKEWLSCITFHQIDFGSLAVDIFLFSSGLLISKSLLEKEEFTFLSFMKRRCLRIVPPLMLVAIVSAFVLGPIVTEYSLKDYFMDHTTYLYLLNGIMVLQHNLPGVFLKNVYIATVNGALWTMPVEFACYVLCYFMKKLGLCTKKYATVIFGIALFGWIVVYQSTSDVLIISTLRAGMFFLSGVLMYLYKDKIKLDARLAIGASIFLIVSILGRFANWTIVILLSYLIVYLVWGGNRSMLHKTFASRLGRYSYTIYLCGFPIQQMFIHLYDGKMNSYLNFIMSAVVSCVCGYIISVVAERPFEKIH